MVQRGRRHASQQEMQNTSPNIAGMSQVKAKKTRSLDQKKQSSAQKPSAGKKKKKRWMQFKKKVKEQKPKVQQLCPPKDAGEFSSNWKKLQEMLNMCKSAAPEPPDPPQQKGSVKTSADVPKTNGCLSRTNSAKAAKHKTVSSGAPPSESQPNAKGKVVANTSASKRKKEKADPSSEDRPDKKKKPVVKQSTPTEEDIWFDDVDPDDLEATVGAEAADVMRKKLGIQNCKESENTLVKRGAFEGLTRAVAIDCEMVGVGMDGEESILARVSLVNQFGKCIYDKYVKPTEEVTDYRTAFSGIRPKDIEHGEDVRTVQKEVADILQGRIVVGHAIHNDLKILLLDHPKKNIRDTQKYKPFRKTVKSCRPALRVLCREILNVNVQQGEHSSVQDAQATMRLYTLVKKQWEAELKASHSSKTPGVKSQRKPKAPKKQATQRMGSAFQNRPVGGRAEDGSQET